MHITQIEYVSKKGSDFKEAILAVDGVERLRFAVVWNYQLILLWRHPLDEESIFDIDYSLIFLCLFYRIQQKVPFIIIWHSTLLSGFEAMLPIPVYQSCQTVLGQQAKF